jgi:hypothetical protein
MFMKKCTIYDCEWNLYLEGVVKNNTVYILENETLLPAWRRVCEHVDYDMVQYFTGYYSKDPLETNKDTSKWGYFRLSTGKVIVPPYYDYAYPFYGDRASVIKENKYGFIDPEGRLVVDLIWDETGRAFYPGLCWVKTGSKYGYVNKNGEVVVPVQLEEVRNFRFVGKDYTDQQYAALVKKDGKYGFINQKGRYIIEPILEGAKSFCSLRLAPVMVKGEWGFINPQGDFVQAPEFNQVGGYYSFSLSEHNSKVESIFRNQDLEFYTVQKEGQWGLLDSDLNIFLPEPGRNYVLLGDRKVYIKEGKVTGIRKISG